MLVCIGTGEVQTCIWPSRYHCHSLFLASLKSRLVKSFVYWLTRVVMDKDPLNGCVSVCVVYAMSVVFVHCHIHYVKTVERIELEF